MKNQTKPASAEHRSEIETTNAGPVMEICYPKVLVNCWFGERPPDHESSARFSPDEEEWFAKVERENRGWAMAKAVRFGVADPELVVSEAMRRAMLSYRPEKGSFAAWLWWILRFLLIDTYRYEVKRRPLFHQMPDGVEFVDEAAAARITLFDLWEWCEAALEQLTPAERSLILLKYDEELTYDEISKRA